MPSELARSRTRWATARPQKRASHVTYIAWFAEIGARDVDRVGGKNASLGELIRGLTASGIRVPDGFAVTADAYREFIAANELTRPIEKRLHAYRGSRATLASTGAAIRDLILSSRFPEHVAEAIADAYWVLTRSGGGESAGECADVAVRSSATAEDLAAASFAGQQDTFLHIRGRAQVLDACRQCYASMFNDRAIAYRGEHGFGDLDVALSVGVQRMVRSDLGSAGVMFSVDPETGFPHAVFISANWGLGESVVQGIADPDEFIVFKQLLDRAEYTPIIHKARGRKAQKMVYEAGATRSVPTSVVERESFVLTDADAAQLAQWAVAIEDYYGRPMDIEWARDGNTGELFIVQARPETVHGAREQRTLRTFTLKAPGKVLATGQAIGEAIVNGRVCRLNSPAEMDRFADGCILVTPVTDPDWVPIMRRAAAIITDHGGRTSHAAIVSRELGLCAVVGTGNATHMLADDMEITVSCAEGDEGRVYEGILPFGVEEHVLDEAPRTSTRIMLNVGDPGAAMRWWRLPSDGVGLARMEFIISNFIKVHPMALVHYPQLADDDARNRIAELIKGYTDPRAYFVETLARGIGRIAAVHYPNPVIVRMSDFKTNEYAELIGGRAFEPEEENPMLGWRGASRYYSPEYRDGFALECEAIRFVRERIGLTNVRIMIPFCRTLEEADRTLAELAVHGLERGAAGLEVYVMCEVPSNVILAEAFAERFDGFSIGSNDLTQLTLGVDRDSARLASHFREDDAAVRMLIERAIAGAHRAGRPIGLCGQAPSDQPMFAGFLVRAGIDSISVTPDSFFRVKEHVAKAEAREHPSSQRA
jgi:pyruvate,water dikinase